MPRNTGRGSRVAASGFGSVGKFFVWKSRGGSFLGIVMKRRSR